MLKAKQVCKLFVSVTYTCVCFWLNAYTYVYSYCIERIPMLKYMKTCINISSYKVYNEITS